MQTILCSGLICHHTSNNLSHTSSSYRENILPLPPINVTCLMLKGDDTVTFQKTLLDVLSGSVQIVIKLKKNMKFRTQKISVIFRTEFYTGQYISSILVNSQRTNKKIDQITQHNAWLHKTRYIKHQETTSPADHVGAQGTLAWRTHTHKQVEASNTAGTSADWQSAMMSKW